MWLEESNPYVKEKGKALSSKSSLSPFFLAFFKVDEIIIMYV